MNAIHTTRALGAAVALAVTVAVLPSPSYAQSEGDAVSRAAVNEETRAALRAGHLMPAGEGSPTDGQVASATLKTRAERKAETLLARRNGEFQPGGMGLYKSNMSQQSAKSIKSRAEMKAETLRAAHEHKLMRAGEAG